MPWALVLASASVVQVAQADANAQAIYERACKICHAAGVANAPKSGDAAAWAPRLEKGMPALLESVRNGLNAMPAGAMCPDCSDADYEAVIRLMSGS
jgi:cytochrome c5